jgi:porphobilinogen deaminase
MFALNPSPRSKERYGEGVVCVTTKSPWSRTQTHAKAIKQKQTFQRCEKEKMGLRQSPKGNCKIRISQQPPAVVTAAATMNLAMSFSVLREIHP